jgi:hypothetical protein
MNEVLWKLSEIIVTFFQAFVVIRFICIFSNYDFSIVKNKLIYVCSGILLGVLLVMLNNLNIDNVILNGILVFSFSLYFLVFSLLFLDGTIAEKVFISIGTNICIILIITIAAVGANFITFINTGNLEIVNSNIELPQFLFLLIVSMLFVYVFELILKIRKKDYLKLKLFEWVIVLVVFLVSSVIFLLLQLTLLQSGIDNKYIYLIIISELGLIIINIFCFYAVAGLSKSNKAAIELELYKQQKVYEKQNAQNIVFQYDEQRRFRHDMKQNFIVIETLLKEDNKEELLKYIGKLSNETEILDIQVKTGNDYVNAILNSKISLAKKKDIRVLCSTINKFDGVEDIDICVLLGNVLDNAIEGCQPYDAEKPCIEINITSDDEKIIFLVKNTISHSIISSNKELISIKQDKENHGFGIKTIKHIAQKYKGNVNIYEEDNYFCCHILLYRKK